MNLPRLCTTIWAILLPLAAPAGALPDGVFVEGGVAPGGAYSATAGMLWAWPWQARFGNAQATGFTEAYLSRWSSHVLDGRETVAQAGVLPLVRLCLDYGRSPWFLEGGLGVSVTDHLYRNHGKAFSTRFNFIDVFGIGRSLGAERRQELSLRLAHVSNANLKKPNPGENFLQLRYAVMF